MKLEVNESDIRIDTYLSSNTDYSRSKIKNMIKDSKVLVNGKKINPSYKTSLGDIIDIEEENEISIDLEKEKMDLDIVYEDEYLIVLNKPSGLVVHPAVGNPNHTLVNGLLYHFESLNNGTIRPGIVHRLDKDTSGLMLVAKNDSVLEKLSLMIKEKQVERTYIALVWGVVKHEKGKIDAPIGRDINDRQKYTVTDINAKQSVTNFSVIERYKNATLIKCKLETGRTHQIRVHLNYIGHPIVNDPVYGKRKILDDKFGQMLHSESIKFIHPITKEELSFEVKPPKEFYDILEQIKNM